MGRLQTDADRARVAEGLADGGQAGEGLEPGDVSETIKKLSRAWFVMRDVRRTPSASQP